MTQLQTPTPCDCLIAQRELAASSYTFDSRLAASSSAPLLTQSSSLASLQQARGGLTAMEGVAEGVTGVAESAGRGDGTGILLGGRRFVDGLLGGGWQALQGMASGSERVLKGTFGGVSYFGKGVMTGAGAVVTGVMEPTEQAARDVRGLWQGAREVCTSHSVYQRTLMTRLGLRRRGERQEVIVCMSGEVP